jgi:3-hydroxymyristoyl/3-hydroxydecanoyl-(acyl carrier protein) dehydratase
MDEHFRAFSFVNRISSVSIGQRIRGTYQIPPGLTDFPLSLAGEAVGQLAAWSAIAAVNFERRPVAGIASKIELLNSIHPGDELELSADLESVDAEAVSYGGVASVRGTPVLRLEHCVGPMVALEHFDDPQALRDRFAFLCASGTTENAFEGVPSVLPQRVAGETGKWIRATIQVPDSAPFFADHFPRRPVFPGTLLMHANLHLAATLAAEIPGNHAGTPALPAIRSVHDVKLRAFTPPGELLESEARVIEEDGKNPIISLETRKGKRLIGTARVCLASKKDS